MCGQTVKVVGKGDSNLPVIDKCFLRGIYCGEVWKEFQCANGKKFLAAPYSLATMINVDWFQPFTHVKYSVGVIYLVILNLPHEANRPA